MSESHFKARFKRETGLSPINFIMRRKMEAAKARLAGSAEMAQVSAAVKAALSR